MNRATPITAPSMRDIRPYARGYPMTLAETASTFGENVLMNGILDDPTVSEQ